MKKNENKNIRKTSIGGQAVIEGVMMRGPKEIAVSVRKSNGEIVVDKQPVSSVTQKYKFLKWPVIRGVVSFIESMILGTKTLMFSAEMYDLEEDDPAYKPSKLDNFLEKVFKNKDVLIYFSVFMALILCIFLFTFLPTAITHFLGAFVKSSLAKSFIEGGVKLCIFVGYILLVSQMNDMKRVFQYHGAEHKTIACYEHGEELTVENVRKHCRFHPRCGTSFLISVMIISVLLFALLPWEFSFIQNSILASLMRVVCKIALLPLVSGVTYEYIKFAGRHDNRFVRILNKPGVWMQHLTTKEPDDNQIEVAICSLTEVIPENEEDDKW